MQDQKFITKLLHAKYAKQDAYGSLHMPVYDSAAFEFDKAEDMEAAFKGRRQDHAYSRISNPTVEHFENKLKLVSGALTVTALSSGMAAIANLFITLFEAGDTIIASKHIFGNTFSLFENTLKPFNLNFRYADLTDTDSLAGLIDDSVKAIFVETITNPQLEVADIKALAETARQNSLVLIADTTLTPPYLFDAKAHGIDVELISSTKYISGGATSVGGLILDYGTYSWGNLPKFADDAKKFGPFAMSVKLKREVFRNMGACLSPHNAYLQSLGLDTLPLRVDRACENAQLLARYFENHKKVKKVYFPGLESSEYFETASKQFGKKPGSLICFELESKQACFALMNALNLVRRSTNLNDSKSLIIHPASTIFAEYSNEQLEEMDVPQTLIRFSVGIEDCGDLQADFDQAFDMLQ